MQINQNIKEVFSILFLTLTTVLFVTESIIPQEMIIILLVLMFLVINPVENPPDK